MLLFLGRIHPKKGLVNLLKAWAKKQKSEVRSPKSEEWVLAVAGWDQGGHEQELKQLATELGLEWKDVRTGGTTGQQDNGQRDREMGKQRAESREQKLEISKLQSPRSNLPSPCFF